MSRRSDHAALCVDSLGADQLVAVGANDVEARHVEADRQIEIGRMQPLLAMLRRD
jgi:hypothetical protein